MNSLGQTLYELLHRGMRALPWERLRPHVQQHYQQVAEALVQSTKQTTP